MKIITFNIRCANDINGNSIDQRAPRLKKILDRYDGDVIGFQEVTPHWFELIKKDYSDDYYIFNKFRSKHKSMEACTIMWKKAKFTCIDKGYFWFSKTPWVESMGDDEKYHCNRICQWALLCDKETKKEFCVFNSHFGFGDDYQVDSVKLIKQTADIMDAKNVIVIGDFNATVGSKAYKAMTKHYIDVNNVTQNYQGTTYHGYGKTKDKQIDFCFVSKTIKPNRYHVIDDKVEGKYPSDHYGIMVEMEVDKSTCYICEKIKSFKFFR